MFDKVKMWYIVVFLFLNAHLANALECYVCSNQEGNTEKCLNTIKTCEPDEDVCYSEISWGSPPYWSQGARKQFYVSKRCSRKKDCENKRLGYMPFCTHIQYLDWKCSECCQGDRCNYFIISGANKSGQSNAMIISIFSVVLTLLSRLWFTKSC